MNGELAKVVIRGFELPEENSQQTNPVAEFHAMFNPESFAVNTDIQFDDSQAASETGSEFKFQNIAPREFSFEFIIDSTGASGSSREVEEEITSFKEVAGFKEISGFVGGERRTLYLSISWGSFHIRCILKSMEIAYNLFRPDGTPIRATISAVFKEYKTPLQKARENPESVLNLTRVRNLADQDNLTNLAKNLYGDGKKYLEVARANGLNTLRGLTSGNRLEFPPVDQLQSASNIDAAENIVQQAIKTAQGKGKDQILHSASQLAEMASRRARDAVQQGSALAQQAQRQTESAVQRAQRQIQSTSDDFSNFLSF